MPEEGAAAPSGSRVARGEERWAAAAVCAGLALAVALLYAPVSRFEFVYCDDDRYVFQNPVVREGLTWKGVVWAFRGAHVANWHPLSWLSHMADVELFGLDAGAHHRVSVGLHAANALLLFLALRGMTGALWPAALIAALFALHPLRVESVAWVAERKDVLSGLFFMATLLAYTGYARRPGWLRYSAVTLCFTLGLLAKPMLVTLPFLLLLLDLWPLGRWSGQARGEREFSIRSLRWLLLEKLPLLALAAASSASALWSQTAGRAMGNLEVLPLAARLSNAVVSYAVYLGKTVWPAGLAVFYPHPALLAPERYSAWNAGAIAAGLLLLAITAVALHQLRRRPYLGVGWLWYLGLLVPVIGLVQVGDQALADRYAYLPLIGIYVAVVFGLRDSVRHRPGLREPLAFGAGALLAASASVSWQQIGHWRDTAALFEHALAVTRDNYFAHNHLGRHFENRGEFERAAAEYREALRIHPGYKGAHSNLGNVLASQGRYEPAIAHFEQALRLDPEFAEAYSNLGVTQGLRGRLDLAVAAYQRAVALDPDLFAAQFNLGSALLQQGEVAPALEHLERAVAIDPGHANAANNLGLAYLESGQLDRAVAAYRRSLELDPAHPQARCNLGIALEKRGDAEAEAAYQRALERDPGCAPAHRYLGYRRLGRGELEPAEHHLRAVLRLRPGDANAHNDLGVLSVRRGEFPRARAHFEAALRLDPGHERAGRNLEQLRRDMRDRGARP